ncbi:MAG: ABC transporter substrate-binding protein, partial [Rhodobacteraceae bacterium]|nr:ABC transporter substrate-binding protein [Paracoccaceae bacterium]
MLDRVTTTAAALALMAGAVLAAEDTITLGMVLEPPNLDPTAGAAAAIDEVVYANIFEGLTRFGPDGSVRPALAASWDVDAEGRIFTFHLHDGVTFHDGTAMDAEDVKFSLDRARAEDSTNAQKALFAGIDTVEVTDSLTVTVTLKAPDGNFPFNMAWGDAVIVAPESIATAATSPVGTGPFRFESWTQGDRIEITRNDAYWGEPAAL